MSESFLLRVASTLVFLAGIFMGFASIHVLVDLPNVFGFFIALSCWLFSGCLLGHLSVEWHLVEYRFSYGVLLGPFLIFSLFYRMVCWEYVRIFFTFRSNLVTYVGYKFKTKVAEELFYRRLKGH